MPVGKIEEFVKFVGLHINMDEMSEEDKVKLNELSQAVIDEAEDSVAVNAEFIIKKVDSFEDLSAIVHDTVVFERGEDLIEIGVHSISATEMAQINKKKLELEPKRPERRLGKNGQPDQNDPHYDKEMVKYLVEYREYAETINVEFFKYGLDIDIPGETDAEKLESVKSLIAGDADKIVEKLCEISNLNEGTVSPFVRPSRRGS